MKNTTVLTPGQKRAFDKIRRLKQAGKLIEEREQTAVENLKGEWQGDWEWLYNGRKVYTLLSQVSTRFDRKAFLELLSNCETSGLTPLALQQVMYLLDKCTASETIRVFRCH